MNLKEIKELINLMNENDLTELEVEREGTKIRIKKSASGSFEAMTEEGGVSKTVKAVQPTGASSQKEDPPSKNRTPIKAPMVGTFYRSPSPEASPYVEIGRKIKSGQVVCIIEAMKLMNEIKSEVSGTVVEILAENGNPVEYGQPLFMIEANQ